MPLLHQEIIQVDRGYLSSCNLTCLPASTSAASAAACAASRRSRRAAYSRSLSQWVASPLNAASSPTSAERSDAETINMRSLDAEQEQPRYSIGDVIQVRDERLSDEEEQSFRVVGVSPPVFSGFVGPNYPEYENIYVYVSDAE